MVAVIVPDMDTVTAAPAPNVTVGTLAGPPAGHCWVEPEPFIRAMEVPLYV